MKLTFSKQSVLPLLTRVNSAVDQKSPQKIRSNILIIAKDNLLTLTGSDNEVKMDGVVEVNISIPGSVTVNSQRFFDVIKNASTDEIELQTIDNSLLIATAKTKTQLVTMPVEDFPVSEDEAFDFNIEIDTTKLSQAIMAAKNCIGINDIRQYLNGLLLEFTEEKVIAVSTDGHRLALSGFVNETNIKDKKVILPRKTALSLYSWLNDKEGMLKVSISETHAKFFYEGFSLTTTLINADFPNYNSVIPEELEEERIIIPKSELKEALTRAKVLYTDQSMGVTLQFMPWSLSISARNADNETSEDSIDINYEGDEKKVSFNVYYLLDMLNSITTDNVVFYVRDTHKSTLIRNQEEDTSKYVLMPMNI